MAQWEIEITAKYQSCFTEYEKKHPRELLAVSNNLEIFIDEIERGIPPFAVRKGFIHNESDGIRAISQKGGYGRGLAETRLYIYGDIETNILHLLCIGGKRSQNRDIRYCRAEVVKITRGAKNG